MVDPPGLGLLYAGCYLLWLQLGAGQGEAVLLDGTRCSSSLQNRLVMESIQ